MADGWITIGVKANTNKFDRQIMEIEKKMQEAEDKSKEYSIEIGTSEENIEKAKQLYEEMPDNIQAIIDKMQVLAEELDNTQPDTAEYEQLKQEFEDITLELKVQEQVYERLPSEIAKQENQLDRIKQKQEEINRRVENYAEKIETIKMNKQIAEIEEAKQAFRGIGSGIQKTIKDVARLALSIIGIRSILLGIRQAVSMLSQYDEDLANKVEAIKMALASALAPIVEFIVDLLVKAVSLLGYVLKLLFGVDIFARASAMSLKKASSSAKELRKQLAGFDEMNVLNADGTTNLGGVGGLTKTIEDMNEIGKGLFQNIGDWLADQFNVEKAKQKIKEFIQDIKTVFSPVAQWIYDNVWIPMKDNFGIVVEAFEPLLQPLREAWNDLIENHLKPAWKDFVDFIKPSVIDPMVKLWKDMFEKEIKPMWDDFVKFIKPHVIDPIVEKFAPIWMMFYNNYIVPFVNNCIDLLNYFLDIWGIHIDHWEYMTEDALNSVNKDTENTGDNIEENLAGALVDATNKAVQLNNQDIDIDVNTTEINEAQNGLSDMLGDLWQLVSKPWEIVTKIVAKGSSSLNNFLQPLRDTLSNIGIKLPFLASGGIVNMPNKGTYIGGAMAGESGRERSNTTNRPRGNGRIRKRNRKECISKFNKHNINEW